MVALNKHVKKKCVVAHCAGVSVVGISLLRGYLVDMLYSWSKNAFRQFKSFHRK